ncbi:MAG: HDOD domain-containing protein [Armatimonadetes bacterium]|nr:HDOD domain-containing protein [Armatimonadota bacterium]
MDLASLGIRIERSENLPVLSQAASQILRLVDHPDVSSHQVEAAIQKDSAITAKILKVANSAFYGANGVPTVGRAVAVIGMNSVQSLVVGITFQQMAANKMECPNFGKLEFWRHSLAVATAARIIGKLTMASKAEELYCAGMMHDIGLLVMDRFLPKIFETNLKLCQKLKQPLYKIENQTLGYDHCTVGGLLAEKWSLTKIIKHAIEFHHNPALDGEYYETTCVIAAADALAHQCGFTNSVPGVAYEIDTEVAEAIGLPTEQFAAIQDVVISEVNRAQEAYR